MIALIWIGHSFADRPIWHECVLYHEHLALLFDGHEHLLTILDILMMILFFYCSTIRAYWYVESWLTLSLYHNHKFIHCCYYSEHQLYPNTCDCTGANIKCPAVLLIFLRRQQNRSTGLSTRGNRTCELSSKTYNYKTKSVCTH